MPHTWFTVAFKKALLSFHKTHRSYMRRPDMLSAEHDEQLAFLARMMARTAREAGLL